MILSNQVFLNKKTFDENQFQIRSPIVLLQVPKLDIISHYWKCTVSRQPANRDFVSVNVQELWCFCHFGNDSERWSAAHWSEMDDVRGVGWLRRDAVDDGDHAELVRRVAAKTFHWKKEKSFHWTLRILPFTLYSILYNRIIIGSVPSWISDFSVLDDIGCILCGGRPLQLDPIIACFHHLGLSGWVDTVWDSSGGQRSLRSSWADGDAAGWMARLAQTVLVFSAHSGRRDSLEIDKITEKLKIQKKKFRKDKKKSFFFFFLIFIWKLFSKISDFSHFLIEFFFHFLKNILMTHRNS